MAKPARHIPISIILTVLLVAFGSSCQRQGAAAQTNEPSSALDSLEARLSWVHFRLGQEAWRRATTGVADSLAFFRALERDVIGEPRFYEALRGRRPRLTTDPDRRRHDLLYPLVVRARIDQANIVRPLHDSLEQVLSGDWCRVDGRLMSSTEANRTIAQSRRRTRRELAFRALGEPGEGTVRQMGRLFRLRNQVAHRLGFNDYFSLFAQLDRFEPEGYLAFLSQVDSITRPAYENLARELQISFGSDPLEVFDWEQRFANTMAETNRLLPVDSQLVFLRRSLANVGFDLSKLPIYFNLRSDKSEPGRFEVLALHAPHDVRIVGNLADGLAGFRRLFGAAGQALHLVGIDQDTRVAVQPPGPAGMISTKALFEFLCTDESWLTDYPQMPPELIIRFRRAERAVKLLHLRLLLVEARFEYDAYRNPNQNLNALYWDLFVEYTGLPRHDDLSPWAGRREYVSEPLAAYHQLLGMAAAGQTWHYLKEHYERVTDNPEVSAFVTHSLFRFGARYDWRELIERATGEAFSAAYLVSR